MCETWKRSEVKAPFSLRVFLSAVKIKTPRRPLKFQLVEKTREQHFSALCNE